jgi:hypothetical protein
MSNSYRIRTQVGVDKSINLLIHQDFEQLEILSLKILSSQVYNRQCSDYGVIVGRISVNNGFGLPNCKVSLFIPLSTQDEDNPVITTLYPYKSLSDVNEDGYRYNLLPYTRSYSAHIPTGTFPDREDALIDTNVIEVYDKYYKFTTQTNESGDYMLFGVPLGSQTIHVDVDLSDIGEFSLSPQDLIRMGIATESQVSGTRFKSSTNLNSLPQIVSFNRTINVDPFWGQEEVCSIGITRTDFDLTNEANVDITPTAIFMGSIFSDVDNLAMKRNCKPKVAQGELCSLVAGPGEILSIRQTIFNDTQGRPILEQFELESGGQVIDDNGTWLVDLPMNLDYVTTNEFGERVFSNDPTIGIPTRGKYRFKIKWNQPNNLNENVKRAYFLVPNVREYGWQAGRSIDPLNSTFALPVNTELATKSYAFSLDWGDYADPQTAIDCEDTFYQFSYNKVYTVSQLIDQYRNGTLANRIISVKNILDPTCESTNNKFPTNDSSFRWDFIFLLFTFASYVVRALIIPLIYVIHVLYIVIWLLRIFFPLIITYFGNLGILAVSKAIGASPAFGLILLFALEAAAWFVLVGLLTGLWIRLLTLKLKGLNLPLLLYDQCEFCSCDDADDLNDDGLQAPQPSAQGQQVAPPALPNSSGLQLTNFEGGLYYSNLIDTNLSYLYINRLLGGYLVQYPPNPTVCYSKIPKRILGVYDPPAYNSNIDREQARALFYTRSITIAERINLFNTKAKYFDNNNTTNPGGGVNQVYVSVNPQANGGGYTWNSNNNQPYLNASQKYHTDNVIVLMMTPDSLQYLSQGAMLSFVNPNTTYDPNYTGATLNVYDTNSITGSSLYHLTNPPQATINVNFTLPNSNSRSTQYVIPTPNTGDTNYHKFPIDVEYFQVVTAMTYNSFTGLTNQPGNPNYTAGQVLTNSLNSRYLDNDMLISIHYKRGDDNNADTHTNDYNLLVNPLRGLEEYRNQVVVILTRGVDPYSTRVQTRFDLGRIFGFTNPTRVSVTGNYKLNIPIQGGFKNVSHQFSFQGTNLGLPVAQSFNTYSNSFLYYNSYNYVPSQTQFSGFSSNRTIFYSSLDNNTPLNYWPNCEDSNDCSGFNIGNTFNNGLRVNTAANNEFTWQYSYSLDLSPPDDQRNFVANVPLTLNNNPSRNRGYFVNELVEGGSVMTITSGLRDRVSGGVRWKWNLPTRELFDRNSVNGWESAKYAAPKYDGSVFLWFDKGNSGLGNDRQIVMRSDRLPTSDVALRSCDNYFALQQNQNFGMYIIPDDGAITVQGNTGGISIGIDSDDTTPPPNFTGQLLQSTNSCVDSRNLDCYDFIPYGIIPSGERPGGGTYLVESGNCQKAGGKFIFENGCYKLVTTVILSIPTDIKLATEWLSRTNITFAACRNVFSHLFTHNWINGTLYAFAFKNVKRFDENNNPISLYCKNTIYFDNQTNNFYYRSSPYKTGNTISNSGFIGKDSDTDPNKNNLLFPTTIMDLGPRTDYIQELVYSDEYDGYIVNQLGSTSYQDVSELLNLLIINRLANSSFIQILTGRGGGSIFNYFSRPRRTVDADYAQMISINSEFGVVPFEAENYPNIDTTTLVPPLPPGGFAIDPVYFNTGEQSDTIFGIFYSSDTQVRDFLSPKRTIINDGVSFNNSCAFSNFYCYSQEVPFYQWEIKQNKNTPPPLDSIFGSQENNWYTSPILGSYFQSSKYQSLDRGSNLSRYFRTSTSTITRDFKGYIYSVERNDPNRFWTFPSYNPIKTSWEPNPLDVINVITVGAPYYFYFGLKKGKSAWDRFAKKWINFENISG